MSDATEISIPTRSFPYGASLSVAELKRSPEDFVVVEEFEPELVEQGEHLAIYLRKRGQNTDWVAKELATYLGVKKVDVGYCGKKDRHAITEQWFSVYVSNSELPPVDVGASLGIEGVEVLKVGRLQRKIRMGDHTGNRFNIRLYGEFDTASITERLEAIATNGFANYFGNQRFGIDGNNLLRFDDAVVNDRKLRRSDKGIILSSARSAIFNHLLAKALSTSALSDLPTSLPMWGRGRDAQVTCDQLGPFQHWCDRLEHSGLTMDQRVTLSPARDLSFSVDEGSLSIAFSLNPGAYATTLLEHLFDLYQPPIGQ